MATANVAATPTPETAAVSARRPDVVAPERVFACPNCGTEYVLTPTEDPPPAVLHFDFTCTTTGCGYKAAVGAS